MAGIENSAAKPGKPRKFTDILGEVGKLQEKIEGQNIKSPVEVKRKGFKDYFEEMNALAKGK